MILVRAPLRLSIAGGGTDLPSYYENYGSDFISAAIDKYIYIALNKSFTLDTFLKYSKTEVVNHPKNIEHPIFRAALHTYMPGPVDIASFADIPSGTGLGSSGSFTVALIQALSHNHNKNTDYDYLCTTKEHISESAFDIEANHLKNPVGKQDQYIAAYGGLTHFNITTLGKVTPQKVPANLQSLQNCLMLFFTGYSRNANDLLRKQDTSTKEFDQKTLDNLKRTHKLTPEAARALFSSNWYDLALIFNEQFMLKNRRIKGSTPPEIFEFYYHGLKNGALGGKLIGAGGGGFLLFITESRDKLKEAMEQKGLIHIPFEFDHEGVKVLTK